MKNFIFYLGVGLLFTHELDAMTNNEWLVLPITSWLPAESGKLVFVLSHVPIFAILVGLIASKNENTQRKTRLGLSIFLVIHGVLHAAFIMHDKYEFHSLLSNSLIFGGAICGALYLLMKENPLPAHQA